MSPIFGASSATYSTSEVIRNFFQDFFLHPTGNIPAVIFFCAVAVIVVVGIIFLVKLVWDRYHPAPQE